MEARTYTISKAAAELRVTPGWLRFGERLGAMLLARRNRSGWRFYTTEVIERLRHLGVGERKRRIEATRG
jgi:DNA-binding transcriptional MerR regulator